MSRERQPLPADACSFYQRAQFRNIDDDDFGADPWGLMSNEQIETHEAARDAEDEKDPPCGKCSVCAEVAAQDESVPEWVR